MADFFIYIMANRTGTLYVGMTTNVQRRVQEHIDGSHDGATESYRMNRLLYYESTAGVKEAIERETEIKAWTRNQKLDLIREHNPELRDLSDDWFDGNLRLDAGSEPTLYSPRTDSSQRQSPGEA